MSNQLLRLGADTRLDWSGADALDWPDVSILFKAIPKRIGTGTYSQTSFDLSSQIMEWYNKKI